MTIRNLGVKVYATAGRVAVCFLLLLVETASARGPIDRSQTTNLSSRRISSISHYDHDLFLVASFDGSVTLFDARSKKVIRRSTSSEQIMSIAIASAQKMAAYGTTIRKKTRFFPGIQVIDLPLLNKKRLYVGSAFANPAISVTMSDDAELVAAACGIPGSAHERNRSAKIITGEVIVWKQSSDKPILTRQLTAGAPIGIAFADKQKSLVVATTDSTAQTSAIQVYQISNGTAKYTQRLFPYQFNSITMHQGNKILAAGCGTDEPDLVKNHKKKPVVLLLSNEPSAPVIKLNGHNCPIYCLSFSKDGKLLASGGGNYGDCGECLLWDVLARRFLLRLPHLPDVVSAIAFSRNGELLVAGLQNGQIRVWSVSDLLRMKHDK